MECKEHDNSICRVCLKCDPTIHKNGASISYITEDVFIYERLNSICDVNIKPEDGLPDRICVECLLELHNAVRFKHKCESSNNLLLSAVNKNSESAKANSTDNIKLEEGSDTDHEYHDDDKYEEPCNPQDNDVKHEHGEQQRDEDIQPAQHPNTERPSRAIDLKLECHDCGGLFKSKCKLKVHWDREHLKQYLTCDKCKKIFATFNALNNHKRKSSKICDNIQNTFRIEGTGKASKFYCKHCEYSTSMRKFLRTHVQKHSNEKKYQCDLCPMSYVTLPGLSSHKEYKHKIYTKARNCEICGEYLKGIFKFSHHMDRHRKKNKNNEVACKICHKVYKHNHSLKEHMNKHTGKTYSCEVCSKKFFALSNLYAHRKLVHLKDKIHICQICGFSNVRGSLVTAHIAKHNGTNCCCNICWRFCENEVQLELHKQRHSDRSNECSECGKTFFARKSFKQHLRQVHNIYVSHLKKKLLE